MGRIVLVRHAQASLLAQDYDQLSELGWQQSAVLGRWWAARGERFDRAWSGSLRRQQQTAQGSLACLPAPAVALQIEPGFDEYSHQDLFANHSPALADPQHMAQLLQRSAQPRRLFQQLFAEAFEAWLGGQALREGALSWPAFRGRCMAALQRVAEGCGAGQTAVVYSSGGAIAAMCQALLGVPDSHVAELHLAVHNTAITRLLCQPGRISLSSFNTLAHLEVPGTPAHLITYR